MREISRRLHISRNAVGKIVKQQGKLSRKDRSDKIQIDPELLERLYRECDGWLQRIHEKLAEEEGIAVAQVEHRTKTIDSLLSKIARKNYANPLEEIKDLCGVRIVTYYHDDVGRVVGLLKDGFEVDGSASVDKASELEIDEFGYRSPNSVTQNLQALHKKNFLRRDQDGYHLVPQDDERHGIPIRGLVSAGQLQEAIEANLGTITLETLFPNLDRIFAIRVAGQSMKGADIHDGDYVLLIDDDIPNGGIGAVLYNGETSLKRIYTD